MYILFLVLILGMNFAISWSNARAVGRYWTESKQIGGGFRAEVVCGYIQAIFGFTLCYCYILMLIAPFFLRYFGADEEFIADFESLTSSLAYLVIVTPIVGSGFRIWFTSLKNAWEQRSLRTIATAGWNSYAQIRNTIHFARTAPTAFENVCSFFDLGSSKSSKRRSSKNNGAVLLLAILLVVLALLGGYFTANAIMRSADAEYDAYGEFMNSHPRGVKVSVRKH